MFVEKGQSVEDQNAVYLLSIKDGGATQDVYIVHPYRSPHYVIEYADDPFLEEARKVAERDSLDPQFPTSTVLVVHGKIVGFGANGSTHHEKFGCKRKELGIATGQGYELCEGCHPKNHSEAKAVKNVKDNHKEGELVKGAGTAYLYGHWWMCEPCSDALVSQKISKAMLSKSWARNFFGL